MKSDDDEDDDDDNNKDRDGTVKWAFPKKRLHTIFLLVQMTDPKMLKEFSNMRQSCLHRSAVFPFGRPLSITGPSLHEPLTAKTLPSFVWTYLPIRIRWPPVILNPWLHRSLGVTTGWQTLAAVWIDKDMWKTLTCFIDRSGFSMIKPRMSPLFSFRSRTYLSVLFSLFSLFVCWTPVALHKSGNKNSWQMHPMYQGCPVMVNGTGFLTLFHALLSGWAGALCL